MKLLEKKISQRVKATRMMIGLSQKKLACAIKVSVKQIQKYENADNKISSGKLLFISQTMGVPIEYFYQDMGQDWIMNDEIFNSISNDMQQEIIRLSTAYKTICDTEIRNKIIRFIESVAEDYKSPEPSSS